MHVIGNSSLGQRRTLCCAIGTIVLLLTLAIPTFAAPVDDSPAALLERIGKPRFDPERTVEVSNLEIDMGPGTLIVGSGLLAPAEPILGRTLELFFVGDALFKVYPDDPIESAQLELFAEASPLVTPVDRAVLVVGDPEIATRLLSGRAAAAADPQQIREVSELFESWRDSAERDGLGTPAAMVKTLVGEPGAKGYFAAWCHSAELGDFYYTVDPSQVEQIALGQFVPIEIGGDVWAQNRLRNFIKRGKLIGRFARFQLDELGDWDTWISTSLQDDQGQPTPGSPSFEPVHYALDVIVDPRYELDAWGKATIRLRAVVGAHRSVDFSLYAGLKVTGVFTADEQPLHWIGSDGSFSVFLPEPVPKGETIEVRIEYEGDMLHGSRILETHSWYPHAGAMDRATYDVTLRHPRKFDLAASGRVVETGEDDGLVWQRRTLEVPAVAFSFELGKFDFVHDTVGHVELTFAFAEDELKQATREKIVATTGAALAFFEQRFGPYPLDYLTVVPIDRGFSQGFLSIVTLAEGAVRDFGSKKDSEHVRARTDEQRDLLIAHELSHQWWGNWVGWDSYRDQWLSEALAEFSSLMFGANTADSKTRFMERNRVSWRRSLLSGAGDGRSIESLGPVVLGQRLASSKSSRGYQAIVYDKGGVIFRMLARSLGEEPFAAMLGELATRVGNRVIDTRTFFLAMQHMSGYDLQPFVDRYVRGTGIPEIHYRYSVEQAAEGEGWTLRGEASLISRASRDHAVDRDAEGRWEIRVEYAKGHDYDESVLVVPFQIVVTPPDEVQKGIDGGVQSARGFGGKVLIKGASSEFEFTVQERPQRLTLDRYGEVLARFIDDGLQPKSALRSHAQRLAALGRLDEAETKLREALDTPLYSERGMAWVFLREEPDEEDLAKRAAREDLAIRIALARLQIEQGRLDGAKTELRAIDAAADHPLFGGDGLDTWALRRYWNESRILWSRLDLAAGGYEAAFRRLKEKKKRYLLGAEGYAILAVAAFETGRLELADESMENAESRGADMTLLRAVSESRQEARLIRPAGYR